MDVPPEELDHACRQNAMLHLHLIVAMSVLRNSDSDDSNSVRGCVIDALTLAAGMDARLKRWGAADPMPRVDRPETTPET